MSTKIAKVTDQVGLGDDTGVNFPEDRLMTMAKSLYNMAQGRVTREGGVVTGPARIYITVEQDFLSGNPDSNYKIGDMS